MAAELLELDRPVLRMPRSGDHRFDAAETGIEPFLSDRLLFRHPVEGLSASCDEGLSFSCKSRGGGWRRVATSGVAPVGESHNADGDELARPFISLFQPTDEFLVNLFDVADPNAMRNHGIETTRRF